LATMLVAAAAPVATGSSRVDLVMLRPIDVSR
jgi:hypothetical protein